MLQLMITETFLACMFRPRDGTPEWKFTPLDQPTNRPTNQATNQANNQATNPECSLWPRE